MNAEYTAGQPIRVLVVDDSAFMRTAITRMLESDPQLSVIAEACDGKDALEKIAAHNPDVITLDIQMPHLDGLGVLRILMVKNPKPVIIVSSLAQEGAEETLMALELGAFDYVSKTCAYATLDILAVRDELIAKVRAAAASRPTPLHLLSVRPKSRSLHFAGCTPFSATTSLIAIGASTGGPRALQEILPRLPADLPAGVVIVQHMPQGFTAPFARRLNDLSEIDICEATDGQPIVPGRVLIAPATWHLTIFRRSAHQYSVRLSKEPAGTAHVPSVDLMMLSAAEVCGSNVTGVILSGMGIDGAEGMKAISLKGGYTIGQNEATCAVYGMSRVCAELGILDRIRPLESLADEIIHSLSAARRASKSPV